MFALFCFSCYLPFSCHLAGNLASGCSLLGLFGSFFWAPLGHFLRPWLTHAALLQGTFSTHFWVPFVVQKYTNIGTRYDQIWGANGRPDALFSQVDSKMGPLGARCGILVHLKAILGRLRGSPGASWGHLVAILGSLGASCGHLGAFL